MDSLRLDKFKLIAAERRPIVNRIRELQPAVTNSQIGRTLGVDEKTVRNDTSEFSEGSRKNANGNNGGQDAGSENSAPTTHRTVFTGENEWFTPSDWIDRAR